MLVVMGGAGKSLNNCFTVASLCLTRRVSLGEK